LLIGAIALKLYGILVPVLERAGGPIVAWSGWTLPNEDTRTGTDAMAAEQRVDYIGQAF
jgi:small neutral amino acid transporter SnatA (MarC family)